ncbi:MAG: FHA domain-containing protein [Actinomycetaceae bacterium]|nr:FHA domain-containing protein [Actinomycetaceae bacterium]MDO5747004.1 FHA domain-containing protein [Actinomycetaceae bacterium]
MSVQDNDIDPTIVGLQWENDMTMVSLPSDAAELAVSDQADDACTSCEPELLPVRGRLCLPSGRMVDITTNIIFGRMPSARQYPEQPIPLLVPLSSPQHLISRTHCEIVVKDDYVALIDHESQNGTFILRSQSPPIPVIPGRPVELFSGDKIDVGEQGYILVQEIL